jgi:molybdopterin-guanine dinucleotide biosynthesis protein
MGKSIGVASLLKKNYPAYELAPEWSAAIGNPEKNFKAIIWGPSGSGKTTFTLRLCKELSRFGRVYYNSAEQGEGKSLQDVVRLVNLADCEAGSIVFGDKDTFEDMMIKLKKNRAKFVVIDSLQYTNLTTKDYKRMIETFKKKAFIIISWEGNGSEPKGEYAKAIRYMVDIKMRVYKGTMNADSRFGETKPFKIFEQKAEPAAQQQLELATN